MCRLFGMSGGSEPVRATFWLLQAPDWLAQQSRREPDGAGIGSFDGDGNPVVDKQPLAAYEDPGFATRARELESRTFVAHVRYASNGALTVPNTPVDQLRVDHPLGSVGAALSRHPRPAGARTRRRRPGRRSGAGARRRAPDPRQLARARRSPGGGRGHRAHGRRPGLAAAALRGALHVDGDLQVSSRQILDSAPAHPLTLADLGARAAASPGAPAS